MTVCAEASDHVATIKASSVKRNMLDIGPAVIVQSRYKSGGRYVRMCCPSLFSMLPFDKKGTVISYTVADDEIRICSEPSARSSQTQRAVAGLPALKASLTPAMLSLCDPPVDNGLSRTSNQRMGNKVPPERRAIKEGPVREQEVSSAEAM